MIVSGEDSFGKNYPNNETEDSVERWSKKF